MLSTPILFSQSQTSILFHHDKDRTIPEHGLDGFCCFVLDRDLILQNLQEKVFIEKVFGPQKLHLTDFICHFIHLPNF